uniref:cache domain-containing protein n=1 Tax=Eisenbergiella massiliensis TaxID=1720294 RepID=UPI0023F17F89
MKHLLRKYFHVTSLRRKMILSFSLLIISALAVLQSANTYQTYIILEQNLTDSVHESLRLGLSNIDYFFEDINNLASGILPEAEVQTALSEKVDYSSLETKSTLRALERTIKKYSATRPYVPKVYLVNLDNQILDNSLQGMAAPEINCDPQTSSLCLSDVHYAPYISQHTPVISFEKNIYSLYTGNQKLGRLIVDMDTRVINQVLYDFSLPMSGETFLINNKKTVLCRSGKYALSNEEFVNALNFSISKKDGSIKINNEKFLCLTETSPLTGWTLCALIPYNLFARSIVIQMNLTLILFVICILAAIIISRPIINSMYKP